MIKIVCGRSAEKIRKDFFDAISENLKHGKTSFLLVPEQQVLAYEDEAMRHLPSSAPLNFTVMSFSLLCDIVLRKHGGLSFRTLSKPIKTLTMWNALRQVSPLLTAYRRTSFEGLCSSMLACTDELKSSGILPEHLEDALSFLEDTPTFRDKLKDISLIYSAYTSLLQNRYGDTNDALMILDQTLKKHAFFEGCDVFIDSFTDFTPIQYRIIENILRQSENVVISLPSDPELDLSFQFESVRQTFTDIKRSAALYERDITIDRSESVEAPTDALSYLSKNIWDPTAPQIQFAKENHLPVELYRCRDLHDEVCACINLIKREIYRGRAYKDIVVLTRNPQKYEKLLAASASQSGIPLFTSDRQPLAGRSFVTYITSLLRILSGGWQRADLLAHLKCGLSGFSLDDVNRFELYVSRWKMNGRAHFIGKDFSAPFKKFDSSSSADDAFIEASNRIKNELFPALTALEKELTSAPTIREMLVSICNYMEERQVYSELYSLSARLRSAGDLKGAEQTLRIYETVLSLFDDTAYCLQDESACSVSELSSLLETLFSVADLGSIPTLQDEVILADASLYRSFGHKTVIVLGLCDGEFPRPIQSDGLLTQAERERLRSEGLPLISDPCNNASKEYLHVWRAFSCAKECLICTYAATDTAGSPTRPSSVWNRISALLGDIRTQNTESITEELLYDPLSMLVRLSLQDDHIALYRFLCEYLQKNGVTMHRDPSEYASLTSDHTLHSPLPVDSSQGPITVSPSALEAYNSCAFSYFCSRILKLDNGKKNAFGATAAGTMIHSIIEEYLRSKSSDNDPDDICISAALKHYDDTCPDHMRNSERLKTSFERAAINASILARYVDEDIRSSSFSPTAFEFNTGRLGGLELSSEPPSRVCGRIDRVDSAELDGGKYLRVIDYKSGKKVFSLENMEKGLQLQLPLYLLSLIDRGSMSDKADTESNAGGFLYLSSALSKNTVPHAADALDADILYTSLLSKIEASGIMNSLFLQKGNAKLQAMKDEALNDILEKARSISAESVSRMHRGDFSAIPQKSGKDYPCRYCAFASLCRNKRGKEE